MEETNVFITKDSVFHGDITAKHISVAGTVKGNLQASSTIFIHHCGYVDGNIKASKIYFSEGAYQNGSIYLDDPKQNNSDTVSVENITSDSVNSTTKTHNQTEDLHRSSNFKKNKFW